VGAGERSELRAWAHEREAALDSERGQVGPRVVLEIATAVGIVRVAMEPEDHWHRAGRSRVRHYAEAPIVLAIVQIGLYPAQGAPEALVCLQLGLVRADAHLEVAHPPNRSAKLVNSDRAISRPRVKHMLRSMRRARPA
jgi:hypothetical protein